jgi:hypothetical protein
MLQKTHRLKKKKKKKNMAEIGIGDIILFKSIKAIERGVISVKR